MSNTQFAALATNNKNYTPAQKTKVFLSKTTYGLDDPIPSDDLTLGAAVTVGDDDITVAAGLNRILYEGTRLNFGTAQAPKIVYISEQTAASATTIPIEPAKVAITNASVAHLKAVVPFLGAKSYQLSTSPEEISDNSFSDGLYMEKAIASLNTSGNLNGPWVYNDPAMPILIAAQESGNLINCELIYPGQRGGRTWEFYLGIEESADRNGMIQRNVNMIISGAIRFLAVNP